MPYFSPLLEIAVSLVSKVFVVRVRFENNLCKGPGRNQINVSRMEESINPSILWLQIKNVTIKI